MASTQSETQMLAGDIFQNLGEGHVPYIEKKGKVEVNQGGESQSYLDIVADNVDFWVDAFNQELKTHTARIKSRLTLVPTFLDRGDAAKAAEKIEEAKKYYDMAQPQLHLAERLNRLIESNNFTVVQDRLAIFKESWQELKDCAADIETAERLLG